MKFVYILTECTYYFNAKTVRSYGLALVEDNTEDVVVLESFSSLSSSLDEMIAFVQKCNTCNLHPIHLPSAIEDFLIGNCSFPSCIADSF